VVLGRFIIGNWAGMTDVERKDTRWIDVGLLVGYSGSSGTRTNAHLTVDGWHKTIIGLPVGHILVQQRTIGADTAVLRCISS